MPQLKEFTAWVTIDGVKATEYGVETSRDKKRATCCIASQLDKKVAVHWTNASYKQATMGIVTLDGKTCGDVNIHAPFEFPETACVEGIVNGEGMEIERFQFGPLRLTDDDNFLETSTPWLGLIELSIKSTEIPENPAIISRAKQRVKPLRKITVHEKSKKTATQKMHIITTKPERLAESLTFIEDPPEGPELFNFSFNYCPLDVLQAKGIAPAPMLKHEPTADPDASAENNGSETRGTDNPISTSPSIKRESTDQEDSAAIGEAKRLTESERTLLEEIQAKQAELAKIRRRIRKESGVKRESETNVIVDLAQARKRVKRDHKLPGNVEVIELT